MHSHHRPVCSWEGGRTAGVCAWVGMQVFCGYKDGSSFPLPSLHRHWVQRPEEGCRGPGSCLCCVSRFRFSQGSLRCLHTALLPCPCRAGVCHGLPLGSPHLCSLCAHLQLALCCGKGRTTASLLNGTCGLKRDKEPARIVQGVHLLAADSVRSLAGKQ